MEQTSDQASFSGWAIVEILGHSRHIGFVTTQAFGAAVLFRVDSPELPEREYELRKGEYVHDDSGTRYAEAGSKVRAPLRPGSTVLVGSGSIYRIVPCTEEAARKAIDSMEPRPLTLLALPPERALAAGATVATVEAEDLPEALDRICDDCGENFVGRGSFCSDCTPF